MTSAWKTGLAVGNAVSSIFLRYVGVTWGNSKLTLLNKIFLILSPSMTSQYSLDVWGCNYIHMQAQKLLCSKRKSTCIIFNI